VVGTGAGYTGRVVGLFEAGKSDWSTIELDNGDSLGSYPRIYDIPLSLLEHLAAGLGPGLCPALATAALIASPAMTGGALRKRCHRCRRSPVVRGGKTDGQRRSAGPQCTGDRWSGTTWLKQGQVDQVPPSLYYFRVLSGGWFEAATVPGTADPASIMEGAGSCVPEVLTDAGGY
jgi:hypothetical protein